MSRVVTRAPIQPAAAGPRTSPVQAPIAKARLAVMRVLDAAVHDVDKLHYTLLLEAIVLECTDRMKRLTYARNWRASQTRRTTRREDGGG